MGRRGRGRCSTWQEDVVSPSALGMLQRVPGSAKHLNLLWGERESGKARIKGIREEGGVVGKESTPDAQAALASTTDGSGTGLGSNWIWRAGGMRQQIGWDGSGETGIGKSPGLLSDWIY